MAIDVSELDFQAQVLDRSRQTPVVVDFWAEWCAPCRALGPLLDRAAASRDGQVVLAKVDVDANPGLGQAFGVQGIPAVKAFVDGQVAAEFVGVQPPAEIERFFDALAPSEAEGLVAAGDEPSLRRALELEPNRADAAVALARLLRSRGEQDEALALVERFPGDFEASGLAARIRLEGAGADGLSPAFAALDDGHRKHGLDLLIDALPQSDGDRDEIRQVVVGVLAELGVDDPLAREYRRRLAAALY